jgi:O-6-methylguanine DNA methyltransferase
MAKSNIVCTNLPSPLGDMIAGATARGLCFLEWHDRGGVPRILERVQKRYGCMPSEDAGENQHLKQLAVELAEYFDGTLKKFETPIDVHGTPFQTTVWNELCRIPYGATCSYGDLAKALGKPGAMRAVGRANGMNYLAVVIPCHRVIEASGGLGGYGGKIWRKKRLLALEGGSATLLGKDSSEDNLRESQPDLFSE